MSVSNTYVCQILIQDFLLVETNKWLEVYIHAIWEKFKQPFTVSCMFLVNARRRIKISRKFSKKSNFTIECDFVCIQVVFTMRETKVKILNSQKVTAIWKNKMRHPPSCHQGNTAEIRFVDVMISSSEGCRSKLDVTWCASRVDSCIEYVFWKKYDIDVQIPSK